MSRWKFLVAGLALAAFVPAVMAQIGQAPTVSRALVGNIRGHILLPNGAPLNQAVRITLTYPVGNTQVIYTDNQGQFDFKRVPIGIYQIEADADADALRYETAAQSVQV